MRILGGSKRVPKPAKPGPDPRPSQSEVITDKNGDFFDSIDPKRHLVRCSVMSGIEVKADSKSIASFGRF